jgi:hypothetical protein
MGACSCPRRAHRLSTVPVDAPLAPSKSASCQRMIRRSTGIDQDSALRGVRPSLASFSPMARDESPLRRSHLLPASDAALDVLQA